MTKNRIKESLKEGSSQNKNDEAQTSEKVGKTPKPSKLKVRAPKLNKRGIRNITIGALAVTVIGGGGFLYYQHYQKTKPVGVEKVVKTDAGDVDVSDARADAELIEVVSGEPLKDRSYEMLWQSKVSQVDNGQSEFSTPEMFRDTMLNLLKTQSYADANQAAALWSRNRLNYAFTSNPNLTNASIGHDAIIVEDYLASVQGVDFNARANADENMAERINSDMQNPWVMAFYAASLHIDGTSEVVQDQMSQQLDFNASGIRNYSIRQFDRDSALNQGTKVLYTMSHATTGTGTESNVGQEFNKAYEAFNSNSDANRVYEVQLSNGKRDAVVVLIETRTGDLYVYGTYFTQVTGQDVILSTYTQSNVVGEVSPKQRNQEPQNWDQFQRQVEEYFGN